MESKPGSTEVSVNSLFALIFWVYPPSPICDEIVANEFYNSPGSVSGMTHPTHSIGVTPATVGHASATARQNIILLYTKA
jgi:hypothetical protein